jgi:prevent-host-death family protein
MDGNERKEFEMVLKRMSSNDVKQRWGTVISTAREADNAVIVESHGTPLVAVIPYAEFADFQEFKEQRRRQDLLSRLDVLEAKFGNRNADLSEEQIEEIAVRAGREINRAAAEKQRARFVDTIEE